MFQNVPSLHPNFLLSSGRYNEKKTFSRYFPSPQTRLWCCPVYHVIKATIGTVRFPTWATLTKPIHGVLQLIVLNTTFDHDFHPRQSSTYT